jgi:hypothetical protein
MTDILLTLFGKGAHSSVDAPLWLQKQPKIKPHKGLWIINSNEKD